MQVFQSAIYDLNYPPPVSDFYDSMDSCGALGVPAPVATGCAGHRSPIPPR